MARRGNFLIIGLDRFGQRLAERLQQRGHRVTAIDPNGERVDACREYAETCIVADPSRLEVLEQLGVGEMDAVVIDAADGSISWILVTTALRALEARRVIIEVNSPEAAVACRMMSVEAVDPGAEAADRVLGTLLPLRDQEALE